MDNQDLKISYDVQADQMAMPLHVEAFSGVLQIWRDHYKLSLELNPEQLLIAEMVLGWVAIEKIDPIEAAQGSDVLKDARLGVEGK
jgi:hypothetical protein